MVPDSEGFPYPQICQERCVGCGLCAAACPARQERFTPLVFPGNRAAPVSYAARVNDKEVLRRSSSGGLFYLFAHKAVINGWAVAGVRWGEDFASVVYDIAETSLQLEQFMGSKYLQAENGGIYLRVGQLLKSGRKVLFFGTPCQIAGLHQFLKGNPPSLVSVELICHGVPSPMLWGRYLQSVKKQLQISRFTAVAFRSKSPGWKKYNILFEGVEDPVNSTGEQVTMMTPFSKDPYFKVFLRNLSLRPSCYQCKYKKQMSGADLTIGDFWRLVKYRRDLDDDQGFSCCCVNTEKGEEFLAWTRDAGEFHECKYSWILAGNPCMEQSVKPNKGRDEFFKCLEKNDDVQKTLEEFGRDDPKKCPLSRLCRRIVCIFRKH